MRRVTLNNACRTRECVASQMDESCRTNECVMSHEEIRSTAHMNASCRTHEGVCMLWLRLVGSFKVLVSLPLLGLFCGALLAKETYNFKEPTTRSHPMSRI